MPPSASRHPYNPSNSLGCCFWPSDLLVTPCPDSSVVQSRFVRAVHDSVALNSPRVTAQPVRMCGELETKILTGYVTPTTRHTKHFGENILSRQKKCSQLLSRQIFVATACTACNGSMYVFRDFQTFIFKKQDEK